MYFGGVQACVMQLFDLISYHYSHTYPPLPVNDDEDSGLVLDWEDMLCFYFFVICPLYFHEMPSNCGSNLDYDSSSYRSHPLHQIRVCGSSSNCCIFSHLLMGPGILGNNYFVHTSVIVLDKVVSYDPHIFGSVLHNVPVVDISLGPPPLVNNVHDLALDNHLFEHRVVGVESVVLHHR